jgi:hypothetical protein
LAALSRFISR